MIYGKDSSEFVACRQQTSGRHWAMAKSPVWHAMADINTQAKLGVS
jgi:hypothetical protein